MYGTFVTMRTSNSAAIQLLLPTIVGHFLSANIYMRTNNAPIFDKKEQFAHLLL